VLLRRKLNNMMSDRKLWNLAWRVSRGTQIPEYVLEGCLAAFKSRNSTNYLYSNPGLKPMH
jgi:hypothetical protein